MKGQMEENHTKGIFCMIGAMAFISVQEAFAKYLGEMLPISQVVWARYIGHLLLMLVILWPKYGNRIFKANRPSMQVLRSLILLLDTALFFFGLTMIGLAEATAIFFTVPALVIILSIPLLGERVRFTSAIAIAIGFIGTLVIVRPGAEQGSENILLGALCVFGAACCTAIYNVVTRKLADADPLPVTLFYTAMIGALVSSFVVPFYWQNLTGVLPWLALISIGLFGGIAHSLIIAAHQYTAATVVAPFMYTQIFWALLLGWVIFAEIPDKFAFMGGALVIISGLYLLAQQRRRAS